MAKKLRPEDVGYIGTIYTSEDWQVGEIVPARGTHSYRAKKLEILTKEDWSLTSWKYHYTYKVVE